MRGEGNEEVSKLSAQSHGAPRLGGNISPSWLSSLCALTQTRRVGNVSFAPVFSQRLSTLCWFHCFPSTPWASADHQCQVQLELVRGSWWWLLSLLSLSYTNKQVLSLCFEFLLRVFIPLCSWHSFHRWEYMCCERSRSLKSLQQSAEWLWNLCLGSKIWTVFQALAIARGPGSVWEYAQYIDGFLPSFASVWLCNEYVWKGKWGVGGVWLGVLLCCTVLVFFPKEIFACLFLRGKKSTKQNQLLFNLEVGVLHCVRCWSTVLRMKECISSSHFLSSFFRQHNSFQLYHVAVKWPWLF